MTDLPSSEFTLGVLERGPALIVRVIGELDHDTSDDLVRTVAGRLTGEAAFGEVRLDFADLAWMDSSGLAALLMIHRHVTASAARLHLDNRPAFLDRMLRVTDVLDHLTAPVPVAARGGEPAGESTEVGAP
jgi:anti-anti-sigma factor